MQHNGWDHALKVTASRTGLVGRAAPGRVRPGPRSLTRAGLMLREHPG